MTDKITLEYKKKSNETPFETYLKYTDEKDKSSVVLAGLLRKNIPDEKIRLLDIGSGNGVHLKMILRKAKLANEIDFVLLEPSRDLIKELKNNVIKLPNKNSLKIVKGTWEGYHSKLKFDVILASHLYHLKRENYHDQLKKMVDYLSHDGVLIFVMLNADDLQKFKMVFKPKFFGKEYKSQTFDEIIEVFRRISQDNQTLTIKKYESVSHLRLPLIKRKLDTITIIEFLLNKYWEEIPQELQTEILNYIKVRKYIFRQVDGIAVIRKV